MINIICSSRYKINRKEIKTLASAFLLKKNHDDHYTLNLVFIGRNKMKTICEQYKKEPIALPVLSFPYKGTDEIDKKFLGEVILCYPQIILLAAERNKRVDNMINVLIEHGVKNLLT